MDGIGSHTSEAASSRARTRNVGGSTFPSAPTAPLLEPFSTFVPTAGGTEAHEVPLPIPSTTIPTMRTSAPREEISLPFPTRSPSESRKVRPFDFQKWVKKFNGTGDPYDHWPEQKKSMISTHWWKDSA